MWRNKTVDKLIREHVVREQRLQATIEKLTDRLMHMADKPMVYPDFGVQEDAPEILLPAEQIYSLEP